MTCNPQSQREEYNSKSHLFLFEECNGRKVTSLLSGRNGTGHFSCHPFVTLHRSSCSCHPSIHLYHTMISRTLFHAQRMASAYPMAIRRPVGQSVAAMTTISFRLPLSHQTRAASIYIISISPKHTLCPNGGLSSNLEQSETMVERQYLG